MQPGDARSDGRPRGIVFDLDGTTTVAVATSFTRELFLAHEPAPDFTVADFEDFLEGPGAWLTARPDARESA